MPVVSAVRGSRFGHLPHHRCMVVLPRGFMTDGLTLHVLAVHHGHSSPRLGRKRQHK